MTTTIVIADDQLLVRTGFRMILDQQADFAVVAEARDGAEAIEATAALQPDIVLMDIRMPKLDGLEATRRILANHGTATRVLMLTTFDLDEYIYDALRAGASGFLLKDVPPEQLMAGIRTVGRGEALLAPTITRRLIEAFVQARPPADEASVSVGGLTEREIDVLRLIAEGRSNAEIAAALVVSPATVKTHVAHVLAKLGVRDRVQAVVFAYESGIVRPGGPPAPASV